MRDYITGKFPCLEFMFLLKRKLGYYMMHCYIPTILCVIISWLGFWIKLEIAGARLTLGIANFLIKGQKFKKVRYFWKNFQEIILINNSPQLFFYWGYWFSKDYHGYNSKIQCRSPKSFLCESSGRMDARMQYFCFCNYIRIQSCSGKKILKT